MNNSVSIIIPAYNASATIARAVRSGLAQPEAAEVIVADDASVDDTRAAARAADDGTGRLRILAQHPNLGPSAARNLAMDQSRAEWIGILDADDFFLSGRLRMLMTAAQDADFIADDMWQVPENEPSNTGKLLLGLGGAPRLVSLEEFILSNVTKRGRNRGELGFLKPLMRREFLARHHLRYDERMRLGEDYELYTRALAAGARFMLLPEAGYVSVMRRDSLSGLHSQADLERLRDCDLEIARNFTLSPEAQAALRSHYLSVDCRLQWRRLIEAVKTRDVKAALATFARPYPVPIYLLERLLEQSLLHLTGRSPDKEKAASL